MAIWLVTTTGFRRRRSGGHRIFAIEVMARPDRRGIDLADVARALAQLVRGGGSLTVEFDIDTGLQRWA